MLNRRILGNHWPKFHKSASAATKTQPIKNIEWHMGGAHQITPKIGPQPVGKPVTKAKMQDTLGAPHGHYGRQDTQIITCQWDCICIPFISNVPEFLSSPYYSLQIERTLVITRGRWGVKIRVSREASTLSRLSRTQRYPRTPMHPALGPLGGRFSLGPLGHWYDASTKMESLEGGDGEQLT